MMKRNVVVTAVAGALILGLTTVAGAAKAPKKEFVGSETCKKCHAEEIKSWKETFHSKIIQTKKAGILKDVVAKWTTDGKNPGPTVGNFDAKKYTIEDVQYVIGSKWKQRYLVKNEQSGGWQFLNKQFNRLTGEWEGYGNKNDWDSSCTTCHTTGYRITKLDEKSGKTLKSEWSELGVGCEACHGPGAKHVTSKAIKDIFNPAKVSIEAQSRVCGYCHIRVENEKFRTAQGDPREDLPAPKVGDSYKAGDDWTKWYPEHVSIPGVQPDKPFDAEYKGDMKGLFKTDDFAKKNGVYEEAKHHQEYQGFLQSKHFKSGQLSCITCHSPHAGKGKLKKLPSGACVKCHDASYTVDKYMPNTGKTVNNLFVRTHTFGNNPRVGGKGASDMGPPQYYE
jgi:cytochrome c5